MQMKEYRISDLFEKVEVQKIQGKANDFPTMKDETHTIPLLTSAGNNQGFKSLLKQQTLSKKAAHQIMLQYHTIYGKKAIMYPTFQTLIVQRQKL